MSDFIKTSDLFCCNVSYLKDIFSDCQYPWEMLPKIKDYIKSLTEKGLDGFKEISPAVFIGKNVTIAESAVIMGPTIIGDRCEIRTGAYIRGNVITGSGCVIGNSTEIKNSILLDGVQIPHYNYVGDSILGNKAHMGAGAVCSNLKADKSPVIIHGENDYQTQLKKVGGILADGADIGCGCVLNPGTVVGKGTSVYPLTSLRGVYPENSIVKSTKLIVKRV